jgi:hypothetical protein
LHNVDEVCVLLAHSTRKNCHSLFLRLPTVSPFVTPCPNRLHLCFVLFFSPSLSLFRHSLFSMYVGVALPNRFWVGHWVAASVGGRKPTMHPTQDQSWDKERE